jgi:hypothetical protein
MDYSVLLFGTPTPSSKPVSVSDPCKTDTLHDLEMSVIWWLLKVLFLYAAVREITLVIIPLLLSVVHNWVLRSFRACVPRAVDEPPTVEEVVAEAFIDKAVKKDQETIDLTEDTGESADTTTVQPGSAVMPSATTLFESVTDAGLKLLKKRSLTPV